MTYHTTRRRILGLTSTLALLGSLMAAGAYTQASPLSATGSEARSHGFAAGGHFWDALAIQPRDAWSRLRDSFQWQDVPHNARVRQWIDHYRANPANIVEITERARPWLTWITEQIESRDLPGEIALIPFVESSFDPRARSHRGAAGLWQFMPGTADALGLRRNGAYDGRLDVVSSTKAALDYIELQAEQWYEGDIELSLAAYNAGAGTVNRARNAAVSRGEQGDYWSLRLPNETMNYVPKLKAIAAIINDPDAYQVALPEIEDAPAFAKIPLTHPLDLSEAARLAGVSRETLAELNPGLINGNANPVHARVLLVPAEREEALIAQLEAPVAPGGAPTGDDRYVVRSGDNLSAIASRHGLSVNEIRQHNGLSGDVIHAGQVLEIPQRSLASR
ncbi:transglycosylase SLT domain-containing protein [Halomonas sp. C05BenzN]|uniref:transglycosylase SLT domain-containing protein n=1 Tax=Halomonas sp. C05BenzN TaxID=3411041 RepID=UPI003B92547B